MDYENQKMIETFYNARQTKDLLRRELLLSQEVLMAVDRSGLDQEFALDLLSHMILLKRATLPTLVGLLKHHYSVFANPRQCCADALAHAAIMDLVNFDTEREQFVLQFDADANTHTLLRQYQYLPPMIVPPLEVRADGVNRGSGYITVQTDSLVLKDNHHNGDLAVDSLNRFNKVALSINTNIVKGIRNSWKHIDKPKDGENFQDYQARVKAFEKYERDSFYTIALMVEMGNRFYLTHKVDKRGRTYAQGYHITTQGNVWSKAILELADKELVQ